MVDISVVVERFHLLIELWLERRVLKSLEFYGQFWIVYGYLATSAGAHSPLSLSLQLGFAHLTGIARDIHFWLTLLSWYLGVNVKSRAADINSAPHLLEKGLLLLHLLEQFLFTLLWLELTVEDEIEPSDFVEVFEIGLIEDVVLTFSHVVQPDGGAGLLAFDTIEIGDYLIVAGWLVFLRHKFTSSANDQFELWVLEILVGKLVSAIDLSFWLLNTLGEILVSWVLGMLCFVLFLDLIIDDNGCHLSEKSVSGTDVLHGHLVEVVLRWIEELLVHLK